jgi:hypothetical protein
LEKITAQGSLICMLKVSISRWRKGTNGRGEKEE